MTVIDNPIINSPFQEPTHHHELDKRGNPTGNILSLRRKSTYITPIPPPRRQSGAQLSFLEPTGKEEENSFINEIRQYVSIWRQQQYPYITRITRQLLDYWTAETRERKLFFCQIEALETVIYITEVAKRQKHASIEERLLKISEEANPGLYRMAFKMATGSGKTVVMAMLMAWQALNKLANPGDSRFSDAFLIITPGVTIRDRLQVLKPGNPDNYYKQRDLVPVHLFDQLHRARIEITNYHAFMLREIVDASTLTKEMLKKKDAQGNLINPFEETPGQMVRRVCRGLGDAKNIVVINDEAHHCYATKLSDDDKELKGEVGKEVEDRRVWSNGIRAVAEKIGVRAVYDLSATPFFLRGSGYTEGRLFPWVVSDFALIDAIESGIVKIPRLPVADDAMQNDTPAFRDIWTAVRDGLNRRADYSTGGLTLPQELEGALNSLYGSYVKYHQAWEEEQRKVAEGEGGHATVPPPVLIVVCSNTKISKMVYDWISGYERKYGSGTAIEPGNLALFRNENGERWSSRPTTILVDSQQLDSGDSLNDDFKKAAAHEIESFKIEFRRRYPDRDPDSITDADILREVMNTVGKPGKLGESVKCVVSVSMLTEGWDVNSVTHILGVRAFSTQLICEQVIGRALRRISYVADEEGRFDPEYAEVYGVPFSFIPTSGSKGATRLPKVPTPIKAHPGREGAAFTFPNVIGYRYEMSDPRLEAKFTKESELVLAPITLPTLTESAPLLGSSDIHDNRSLYEHREQEVMFRLARLLLERFYTDAEGMPKAWYFPQLITIVREWMNTYVTLKGGFQKQHLLVTEIANIAAEKINAAIVRGSESESLRLVISTAHPEGSSSDIDFETTKQVYRTSAKCPTPYIALDSGWEAKLAQALEFMPEVVAYVKNEGMNLQIPYVFEGIEHVYIPDFIVRFKTADGSLINLIVEVSGERRMRKEEKDIKISTTRDFWVKGVNDLGLYGRWDVIEITEADIDDSQTAIRRQINAIKMTQSLSE